MGRPAPLSIHPDTDPWRHFLGPLPGLVVSKVLLSLPPDLLKTMMLQATATLANRILVALGRVHPRTGGDALLAAGLYLVAGALSVAGDALPFLRGLRLSGFLLAIILAFAFCRLLCLVGTLSCPSVSRTRSSSLKVGSTIVQSFSMVVSNLLFG